MATTGWYGPGWWSVGSANLNDLALIAAQHATALALLEERIQDIEDDVEIDGGTPDSTYDDDWDGGAP